MAALLVSHRVCPSRSSSRLGSVESRGSLLGTKAVSARVPCQRAHAGRPRLTSLRAPGDWRLDDGAEQGRGHYWPQSTITQQVREGRGLFREGHDWEAFSRPVDAIFSLIFFVCLFTPFCCLLLIELRVHDYRYIGYRSASYILGGGRLFVPAGLSYRSFR